MRTTRRLIGIVIACAAMTACDDRPTAGDSGAVDSGAVDSGAVDAGRADAGCSSDLDCQDGLYCNGPERCDGARCVPAGAGPCLTDQICDEDGDRCVTDCARTGDADGDGVLAMECGGDDCDDRDADTFPGNPEVCDGLGHDEDCDPTTAGTIDDDSDGFVSYACCQGAAGARECGPDCDDTRLEAHPGADELCNAADDDCDERVDEGVEVTLHADCDGDGVGGSLLPTRTGCPSSEPAGCPGTAGGAWVEASGDCDDANAAVRPGATEVCNGADDDCDGASDEPAEADASCAAANATAACESGACAIATCDAGYGDCDASYANGCELGLTSASGCGACGVSCAITCGPGPACDPAVQVAVGFDRTCAVLASGRVICWGTQELGDGSSSDSARFVFASGLTDATQVSVGQDHACAVRSTGRIACWGSNSWGQLGTGGLPRATRPEAVASITNAVAVSAGASHTCAVLATGEARCWGRNAGGSVGDGSFTQRDTPVAVMGLTDAIAIAAGNDFTCALRAGGAVACWGRDHGGNLGFGATASGPTHVPHPVLGLDDAIAVAAGNQHACAIRTGGQAVCWGRNTGGSLGIDTLAHADAPTNVVGLPDAAWISAGWYHTCAVRTDGVASCWGSNGFRRIGDGTTMDRLRPVDVMGIADATQIGAGYAHSCALRAGGRIVCWGSDANGQLGDGMATIGSFGPTPIAAH